MGKGLNAALEAARHAKALRDIILAAMRSGWQGAAVAAVKHYWPYILGIVLALLLLPILVVVALPSMLFGFGGDTMTAEAANAEMCYSRYPQYISSRIEEVYAGIRDTGTTGTGTATETGGEPLPDDADVVERTVVNGSQMELDWFIAIHGAYIGNDLSAITIVGVEGFASRTISCHVETIVHPPSETEPGTAGGGTGSTGTGETGVTEPTNPTQPMETETSSANQGGTDTTGTGGGTGSTGTGGSENPPPVSPSPARPTIEHIVTITYLSPEAFMEKLGFDEEQQAMAYLLHGSITDSEYARIKQEAAHTEGSDTSE